MNVKAICVTALALSAAGAPAFAGALDVADNIAPFYTDSTMKELRPMPEFRAAFMATPKATRGMMVKECQEKVEGRTKLCDGLIWLGGMN
ncbi:hypothetical protein [Mesorhizobium sp. M7A.F.Ce.TU.012.03.2.1]|uniref:hypothetical protein n=1 Tax=Mesorhizobium sp. M7A.F.Ce.TU.012.03.2.1 TaxID=2493681 RepID=UPI000FD94804|nr:hypothetical protein [Mesorhizobium sp. M7A.F.Ce.TU.012.03.2.1]AZV19831.1 hypothetical protein EJ079_12780 [Mesorhizobium sp. M7A.F.Ce.TU.012.03.2.1]RWO37549.1 MAG: hypothetical protein EOS12_32085 [Mesorhizobium sp.]TIN67585.1 MAG: hypothetical protein E5Y30_27190 [Mesorhizobium sp.]